MVGLGYTSSQYPFGRPLIRYNNPAIPNTGPRPNRNCFVWPRDGKPSRNGNWGRLKDLFYGQGPDIFVSRGSRRPMRMAWSNRYDLWPDAMLPNDTLDPMPWARRPPHKQYDFRRRKYKRDNAFTWADANWEGCPKREKNYPNSYRCTHGGYYQMTALQGLGGFGLGADGHGPLMNTNNPFEAEVDQWMFG